jgi:hypothetical protein
MIPGDGDGGRKDRKRVWCEISDSVAGADDADRGCLLVHGLQVSLLQDGRQGADGDYRGEAVAHQEEQEKEEGDDGLWGGSVHLENILNLAMEPPYLSPYTLAIKKLKLSITVFYY